jgi:hypothetical protein
VTRRTRRHVWTTAVPVSQACSCNDLQHATQALRSCLKYTAAQVYTAVSIKACYFPLHCSLAVRCAEVHPHTIDQIELQPGTLHHAHRRQASKHSIEQRISCSDAQRAQHVSMMIRRNLLKHAHDCCEHTVMHIPYFELHISPRAHCRSQSTAEEGKLFPDPCSLHRSARTSPHSGNQT